MLDGLTSVLVYYAPFFRGPIVYRLGHELFMLVRGVRLSLGLPFQPLAFSAWETASMRSERSSKPTSVE